MPLSQEFAASFGRLAANHLWQSTAFAAVAVLLALALRANHARARYWLWLAASVKFLVPFSALAAIGGTLGRWLVPTAPVSRVPFVIEQIVQPFAPIQDAAAPVAASASAPSILPAMLLAVWLCGFIAVLLCGWARWRQVAAAVRSSTPLTEGRELETLRNLIRVPTALRLVASTAKLEPGVLGIFRPVLWLPAGIGHRLEDAELEAILAHELCHVRRRDNLLAAIHMLVEAMFWFHPLVWWLGARLEEERERACDEEVVRMGGEPQIYAESILKVCEFYLASPVACAAGVTGGELKKRIEGIMTNRFTRELSYGKKMLLTVVAMAAVAGPVVIGLINPPRSRAQAQTAAATAPTFEVASVKPASPDQRSRDFRTYPGGRLSFTNVPLGQIILEAFNIKRYQLSGGPRWLDTDAFNIDAKAEGDPTRDQMMAMLQTLLADRFQLKVHRATHEGDVYALVVAKGGAKLKESTAQDSYIRTLRNTPPELPGVSYTESGQKASMAMLASRLASIEAHPVSDQTGLKGEYDFKLDYATDDNPETGRSISSALQEQLGLKLEVTKGPVEVLVIDSVNRTPTEN
jgi:uncharacterized protein (TIGR03435 family)